MKATAKKTLRKAQTGTIVKGPVSTKKTTFGRTKITTSQDGNYPSESSKSVRTDVYDKEGNWLKQKTKSTVTDKATGDTSTYKIKARSQGPNTETKKRISRAVIPVQKKGGSVKKLVSKKPMMKRGGALKSKRK